jgi:hypothetical protein
MAWRSHFQKRRPTNRQQLYPKLPRISSSRCRLTAAPIIRLGKAKALEAELFSKSEAFEMVGATGIEPVTPTMPTHAVIQASA